LGFSPKPQSPQIWAEAQTTFIEARRRLGEYLLRAPFSLEKIHWNESSQKVIYRSKRSWHTKQNFQVFTAPDFIAVVVEHIPPKGQQTVRYYGRYSNKRRGWGRKNRVHHPVLEKPGETSEISETSCSEATSRNETLFILPAPEAKSNRSLKPLWRDLILKNWGDDPLRYPCCSDTMKNAGMILRRAEIEFFLRLWSLWEGVIALRSTI